ncbi:MAG TPA: hypothetical protein VGP46_07105, partial [Acidimicrobiales bacterium]|nr:hypothetical protein [Acidimicrobiales bacterium]
MEESRHHRRAWGAIAGLSAAALLSGCSAAAAAYHGAEMATAGTSPQLHALPHSPVVDGTVKPRRHRRARRRPTTTTTTVPLVSGTVPVQPGPGANYGPCTASAHPVSVGPVTVIGDSVTIDFEPCLADDIADVNFDASVGQ